MSSIRNITASNPMPVDLAKRLGKGGIAELLSVMWQGYDDLHDASIITKEMNENAITEEWFLRVNEIWHQENRAARVSIHLSPITQLGDDTMAKPRGQSPAIDFCFRAWNKNDGYFGAECKNLYDHDPKHIKRYVETGVCNYTSGRYGSKSSVSSLVGYVLTGKIPEIVDELKQEIAKTKPRLNISREIGSRDVQYKSSHIRDSDGKQITIHHLLFNFVA
ncbi:hypothetical protein [Caproiciproducens sp. CPB-2]|uniref:hypothetical protein n=1 Tax=Caproiciproducens sp. CPB-2 TaxID=3030017 RepID=UPI000EBFE739|nr:hypothetical protein [Caproiciproducens sp. CPB-2]MDD3193811.1 hypothetical protein [Oscillospiraceae bacterium]MDF1494158.1 hypothetical protein [Caproiciproducens sp. CPB-2]HCA29714.1 hypothetical protein [Oscillospiraceae bacterium]